MRGIFVFGLTALILFILQNCAPAEGAKPARVTILVVDSFGVEPSSYYVSSFVNAMTGIQYANRFEKLNGRGIPPGRYKYELRRSDIAKPLLTILKGDAEIGSPDEWITVVAAASSSAGKDGREISVDYDYIAKRANVIRIIGYKPTERTWLQARRLFTGETQNVKVMADGRCILMTELGGPHVLVLSEGARPIYSGLMTLSLEPSAETKFEVSR